MANVIIGLFANRNNAENAINELQTAGYNPRNISIIMKDTQQAQSIANNTNAATTDNVVSGATTGGVIGAIAGLLIGIGAIAVPGIGALLIGGPIAAAFGLTGAAATTAAGAATGVLAGGLIGALSNIGVSNEDARMYEERIKQGDILLAVPTNNDSLEVQQIMTNNGAYNTRAVSVSNL